jgi:hypothetical protein
MCLVETQAARRLDGATKDTVPIVPTSSALGGDHDWPPIACSPQLTRSGRARRGQASGDAGPGTNAGARDPTNRTIYAYPPGGKPAIVV